MTVADLIAEHRWRAAMNVAQLITKLQQCDQAAFVLLEDVHIGQEITHRDAETVHEVRVRLVRWADKAYASVQDDVTEYDIHDDIYNAVVIGEF